MLRSPLRGTFKTRFVESRDNIQGLVCVRLRISAHDAFLKSLEDFILQQLPCASSHMQSSLDKFQAKHFQCCTCHEKQRLTLKMCVLAQPMQSVSFCLYSLSGSSLQGLEAHCHV